MYLKLSHLCWVIYLVTLSDAMTLGDQIKEAFAEFVLDTESFLQLDEHGKVVNCGPSNMSLTWTPKTINSKGTLTIDGYAQFPAEFQTGTILMDVKYKIFHRTMKFQVTCSMMQTYGIPVQCPVKQGQTVKGQFTIKDLSALSSIHGSIEVKILLYNNSGTQLFCGIVIADVN
ncbi:hypothetical protein CHS0354_020675 [Potamilus streckersoni]|uniref:MD-2-related lipid-recognition domain-containing protein n=1 Tax=Potamilus streckersoni TaxID=2493646 RepID=A0AAE0SRT7_9BIVA|nr:hypothetical protein CHS0354_020675 [Potamilus streckersoni]